MEISFKYGSGQIKVSLPQEKRVSVLSGQAMKPLSNSKEVIHYPLSQPIGCPPLREIVKSGERVAIVVSDRTRTTGAPIFLPLLLDELNSSGIPDSHIFIVFATGTHPLHSREQQEQIVGPQVAQRVEMFDHDCKDKSNLVYLGETSRGTPLWLNKKVVEADRKILTGNITYHYYAGFGGGRKSVLPGIAGFETIQANHRLSLDERCTTAALDDNPLSLDMEEAAQILKPDFILNTVLNVNKQLCGVFAGDLIAAHRAGCEFINQQAMVKIKEKADLVVAASGGGGMDLNFVQSHKAMENAHFALKDGGVMILLAQSSEGFPSDIYLKYIELGSSLKIHEELNKNFTIPGHTIYITFRKAEKYKIIWVSKLPKEIVHKIKITAADSFEEAYALANDWLPKERLTYLMPVAYTTFPVLS